MQMEKLKSQRPKRQPAGYGLGAVGQASRPIGAGVVAGVGGWL
jgi:hypothetical protein